MDLTEWILQKKGSVNLKTEQHKVSKLKKEKKACWKSKGHSLCYLWNIIKCSNVNVVGASEKEKRDWDFKNLRKIIGFFPPNLMKSISSDSRNSVNEYLTGK